MSNLLVYKNYRGQVDFSVEDNTFFGKVLGINDLITFEGSSVEALKQSFKDAVNDYLETCKQLGKKPEKEYKGQFNVRVSIQLHKLAARAAAAKRITLNKFVELALVQALEGEME